MTPPAESRGGREPQPRDGLPSEIVEILWPAIQAGGLMGVSGFVVGGFAGVIRSSTPTLFALASGIQWFTLGSTFWASRGFVLHAWGKDKVTPRDKVYASAIAGGVAGTGGGLLRGPRNIIPGAVMFALFGAAGQALYNRADTRNLELSKNPQEKKKSWLDSKWSPVTVLTDETYENLLQEKLLSINARIALIDESIEALRDEERKASMIEYQKQLVDNGALSSRVSKTR